MEQSQYHHFLSRTQKGAEVVVMPVRDRDHIGCFANQVKLTRALVQDLDEAIKEVNLLEDHRAGCPVQEVEGRCSEAEGGEDHPVRNDLVP
jgi:hypothetical protein